MQRLLFFAFYVFALVSVSAQTDSISIVAAAIKHNVAAINSRFASGTTEQGFGFVVGERDGILYLVTAGHVVMEEGADPGKENASKISIVFCENDLTYTASVRRATIQPFDFALLEMPKPSGYVWKADCLGSNPKANLKVGYIGRANDCYVPTDPTRGYINRVSLDRLFVDFNRLSRGTSGAPLIGPNGIIGMIISADQQANEEVLTIDRLRNEVTNEGKNSFRFGVKKGNFVVPEPTTPPIGADKNLVKVEGGKFKMGCIESRDGKCNEDETPAHEVSIKSFYLGKYEVTNTEYVEFLNAIAKEIKLDANLAYVSYKDRTIFDLFCLGKKGGCPNSGYIERIEYNPQLASNPFKIVPGYEQHPVVMVTMYGAQSYCNWLSTKTGKTYRLPTEAEWEFAARGGIKSKGYTYSGSNDWDEVSWSLDNSANLTHEIRLKDPNELGLYDMSGNVWEWCKDWYSKDYYKTSPANDPQGPPPPPSPTYKVLRGGAFGQVFGLNRNATRYSYDPNVPSGYFGFRVARNGE